MVYLANGVSQLMPTVLGLPIMINMLDGQVSMRFAGLYCEAWRTHGPNGCHALMALC